jgi:dihydrofolate synthase / folylpolyglutamate synthase
MIKKEYCDAAEFLESLVNISDPVPFFGKNWIAGTRREKRKIFIKRLRLLLKLLGNPDRNLKFIHITGTSGKTSTTFFTAGILRAAGFKVGVFASPHVTSITERIHLNDKLISAAELIEIIEYLKPFLSICAAKSPYGCPSFFETMLAVAIVYFKKQKCDYAVLEAGIGGMFDATNVIKKSVAQIITNVGLDHLDVLGKTREEIARDKAGIIKSGGKFFTAERDPKIYKIFADICRAKKVPFRRINGDYKILKSDLSGVEFLYEGEKFKIKLAGEHQAGNAVLAYEAVKKIVGNNHAAFRKGIAEIFVPCRLEEVSTLPRIILDGAHNVDKMKTTAEFIRQFHYNKLHLIIGLAKNKDAAGILREIVPLADKIYLTRFLHRSRKGQYLQKMNSIAGRLNKSKPLVFIDPHEAMRAARKNAGKNDLILVTGSFFLAGELRGEWFSEEYILKKRKMV